VNYHPKGRRRPGWQFKRLLDDMIADTETGHPGLNSWWNMMMMTWNTSSHRYWPIKIRMSGIPRHTNYANFTVITTHCYSYISC
jgi:hypothetical protein